MVVSELSRLGRSLGQIVAILDAFAKAGVAFVAMKENIRVEGKRDLIRCLKRFLARDIYQRVMVDHQARPAH